MMDNRLRLAMVALAMATGGAAAHGQGQPGTMLFAVSPEGQQPQVMTFSASTAVEARITAGRPYSAEATTEFTQVLGDGNRIARKVTVRIYRDSDGRTRREELAADGSVQSISIYDTVGHVTYVLDPATRTARKSAVRVVSPEKFVAIDDVKRKIEEKVVAEGRHEAGVRVSGRVALVAPTELPGITPAGEEVRKRTAEMTVRGRGMRPPAVRDAQEMKEESLGQKVVEGVMADGKRVTTTLPAGAIGNQQPITVSAEQWFSPDLEILVMTKHSDPRSGETSYTLTNIVRAEPQAGLFDLPSDYTVVASGYMRYPAEQ